MKSTTSNIPKTYKVNIQREAIDELDAIFRHISEDTPVRARTFLKELKSKILTLKTLPERGSRIKILEEEETNLSIRFLEYKDYLIFYTIEEAVVTVLHVSSPGQNWITFFAR